MSIDRKKNDTSMDRKKFLHGLMKNQIRIDRYLEKQIRRQIKKKQIRREMDRNIDDV